MKCPTCNFENSNDSKFCCGCGRPIPCCPTCGNVLTTRDRFCVHDGTRLSDELLMLVPEVSEEVVEQVDVVQAAAPVAMRGLDETVQIPVKKKPDTFCLRCGSPVWQGEKYCFACRSDMQKAKPVCASCGMPCEPGEDYCSYCRLTDPVPVANMDYIPEEIYDRPAKPQKKKGSVVTAILVILLLLLIGAAVVLVAAEFDLIELPGIFGSQDSGSDRDKDRDSDDDDDDDITSTPGSNGGSNATAGTIPAETTAPTTAATTAPTTAPTTAATEPTTQPTQSTQNKLEHFIENCDSMYFTREDIAGFTADDCWYARNACYAQAGRKFSNKVLQTYFNQCDWYTPTYEPSYFADHEDELMNKYENANRRLISAYEKEMGYK